MDNNSALTVSKLATVRIHTPIEVTSVWPMAGIFAQPTVFTFHGQNLMELTPYPVYCTLGSAGSDRYLATVVDKQTIECSVGGPRIPLSVSLLGLESSLYLPLKL